jgi:hypothetical protein
MSRIKHPVRAIREPFGTAGLVVAVIALVLALTGAAFAAAGLTGKQKKEVTKIAKKYAGKPGAQGPAGAAGPAGPTGPAGKNGTTVTTSVEPKGANCAEGGTKIVAGANTTYVCNGDPASYPTSLPSKQTEKGGWSVYTTGGEPPFGAAVFGATISFPIPLEAALTSSQVHYVAFAEGSTEGMEAVEATEGFEEVPSTQCLGTPEAPTAKPGNLCVYQEKGATGLQHVKDAAETELPLLLRTVIYPAGGSFVEGAGTSKFGAGLLFLALEGNKGQVATGSWAVTAP